MAERRIFIDANYVDFVKELTDSDSDNKIFDSMAQCLAFAASYGYHNNKREVISRASTSKVDPINPNIFTNKGVDTMFDMLAIASEVDKSVLQDSDNAFDKRAVIFEEYAKGGLALLKGRLSGQVNYLDAIIKIIIDNTKSNNDLKKDDHFDITKLTMS